MGQNGVYRDEEDEHIHTTMYLGWAKRMVPVT